MNILSETQQKMMALTLRRGAGVTPIGIDLDGVNDYGSLGVDLTGNADGKTFTFSCWVYIDATTLGDALITNGGSARFGISTVNTVGIRVQGKNSSGTDILRADIGGGDFVRNTWTHLLISADMANSSNRAVYVDDQDFSASVTWSTYTNAAIDFTDAPWNIGGQNGTPSWEGRLAHLYLDYVYRDLSVESNRRLFIQPL